MARRKRRQKIKHAKTIYRRRKTKGQKTFAFILFVAIILGLVFLGISIGEPVMKFFKERQSENSDSSSSVWTPPESTSATTTATTTTDTPSEPKPAAENGISYILPQDALLSEQALTDAVKSAKANGYSSVVVNLKAEGGEIYFATENQVAIGSNAVVGTLTATNIAKIISDNGAIPVAEISTLKDHIIPRTNASISYTFEGSGSIWLDNSPENGGKAWVSPFSDTSKEFITQISSEISKAGFKKIIVSDLVFPPFRNSDLNYVGAKVKDANRHTALTALAQLIKAQTDISGGETLVKVPAIDILLGTSEVFVPSELSGIKFVAEISPAQIPGKITLKDATELDLQNLGIYDKVKTVLMKASEFANGNLIIPSINKDGLTDADFDEVIRALTDLGYKEYFVR